MRIPKFSYALRRIRHVSSSPFSLSSSSPSFLVRSLHSQSTNSFFCLTNVCNNHSNFRESSRPPPLNFGFSSFTLFRSLSGHSSTNNPEKNVDFSFDGESTTESEILNLGFDNGSEVAKVMLSNDGWYVPIVQAVASVLDQYHDLTNFPWWVIIATSTLALRVTLLPVLIVQLQKLKTIAQLFPQLPPPFPPPFSGKSYVKQFLHFRKVKRAIGCPSFLWNLAYVSVQIPCFLLWMTTIRRMSLNHHPDFDCGGALWFQNLTELPNGVFGPIFPILIAGLHYTNIQISFRNSSVGKMTGVLSLLAKYYKLYLDILTLPILVIGFYIPQGSLVYWVTNSSLTVIQQLSLNHPAIREKLGLPDKNAPVKSQTTSSVDTLDIRALDTETPRKVSVRNLSPDELLSLSIQMLAKGDKERAITLLRLALEKDPDHVRSIVVLGQTMLQKGMLTEAIENLEFAISKLFVAGLPTKDEEIDLLILSSSWAGVACIRQERFEKGLEHLQRILQLEEPQDPKGKAHYFDGLLLLASALLNNGRKDEAVEYLRKVVAYDPSKSDYLEQCLEDDGNITTNQRNSE